MYLRDGSDIHRFPTEKWTLIVCTAAHLVAHIKVLLNENENPKHPEYVGEKERLSTFRTWRILSPEVLCQAGFFYTG